MGFFKNLFEGKQTEATKKVRENVHCWNLAWVIVSLILVVGYVTVGALYIGAEVAALD